MVYFPMTSEVTLSLMTFIIVLLIMRWKTRKGKPLPGPWGLPILGNILQIGKLPHISLTKMKEKYGDVFLIHLGMVPVVVVSGLETVKKVLLKQGEQFADRPKLYTLSLLNDGTSLSFTEKYGEPWKLHKKIAKMCLREFSKSARSASSPSLFEQYVTEEANLLAETLIENSSKKGYYNPIDHITYAVANVVCALCFGKRYDHDDDEFLGVIQISEEAQNSAASAAPADFIPILRYFPLPGLKALLKAVDRFNNFSKKQIKEHYNSFDKNHIRDITDALLLDCSIRKLKDKHSVLTDAQVLSTVIDVFGAGFDTTSSALQWSIFYLLKFPELQEKIHNEIGTKIGFSRMPRFEDRKKMHFMEAFIHEVFRHSSFSPFTLPHCTTTDTFLNGHFIPKDTCVFVNVYQVHHDPTLWEKPECFIPDRFLDKEGKFDIHLAQKILIFGMGVRKCLGKDIACNQLFLMLTIILQRLKFEKCPATNLSFTPVNGMSLKPQKYMMKAVQHT